MNHSEGKMFSVGRFLAIFGGFKDVAAKMTQVIFKFKAPILIAVLGVVGLLSGAFVSVANPYDFLFKWKCIFSDGGEVFELWKSPPVDLYLRVFLWNVTNRDAFLDGTDDKLKMEQVGPYVYREMLMHDSVMFNNNATLSTIPRHPLIWVPELSEGHTEDDVLILPNIALLSIAHVVSDESYFTRVGLNLLIRQTKTEPLLNMTAKEFMFGYKSTLMTLGNKFMPSWIYFDKLGLIDRMYDFQGDYETVHTGEKDIRKAGLIDTYKGSTKLPQWESPCGDISGASDATKFAGFIQPNDTLLFYRKSMCRAKRLVPQYPTTHSGLDATYYRFEENADDNGAINPENKCYCKDPSKCLPPGLLDVHGCYYGFPIALSNPHFYGADASVAKKVDGMQPNQDDHLSYFIVEPSSGLPLNLAVRFQINMALGSIKTVANVERFNDMILPLLWGEFRLYSLPDFLIARFRLYLKVLPVAERVLMYVFYIFGSIFLLFAAYKLVKRHSNKSQEKLLKNRWMEDDIVINIERKLSNYGPERRDSMSPKELEVYYSSLVAPLNQELSFQEFQEMREDDV